MQFILLELIFDGSFNNILKFSHDSIIYHENLVKLKKLITFQNLYFIFFTELFINYPIIVINYFIELVFNSSQIGYFFCNSLLIVLSYLIVLKIFNTYLIKDTFSISYIILISYIINPYIYYFSLFRGEDLLIFILYIYILFFVFYFCKYTFYNFLHTLKNHFKFRTLSFLLLIFSIYLFWLRPSIILLLIISISLFYIFKKLLISTNLLQGLFIFIFFIFILFFLNNLSFFNESIFNFIFDQNQSFEGNIWKNNPLIPNFIENLLFIISNKRSVMFEQSLIYNSFIGLSRFENSEILSSKDFILSFPLIFFHSIFIFDFNYTINSNDPIFLIHFAYSFLVFVSLLLLIFEFKYLNVYRILFITIFIITNTITYYVTPVDGTFFRYMMPLNFFLSTYGLIKIFFIGKYFYLYFLKKINVGINKEFTRNIKLTFSETTTNSFLFILFSVLIFLREFLIFNDFHYDSNLIIYFVIMSLISFISVAFINPFTDTLTNYLKKKNNINQLSSNLLILYSLFFFIVFFILLFIEINLGSFYKIINYKNNFNFIILSFVIFSIPINTILSSYLITIRQSKFIFINQLIIPIIFYSYYLFFGLDNIFNVYILLTVSVFFNFLLLFLTCYKFGFKFHKFDLYDDFKSDFIYISKSLGKNLANNIYIPLIFFLSILVTANLNHNYVIFMAISIKLLSFFYTIIITLLSSSMFNFLDIRNNKINDKNIFTNLLILVIPFIGLIFISYPFLIFFIEPFVLLIFKDINSTLLLENIIFILFITPLLVFFGVNNKFFIFMNKQYLLFISNIISLVITVFIYIFLKNYYEINHFFIILLSIICFLFFSYIFLFNSIRYKLKSLFLFIIFNFALYLIYYFIFSNLFIVLFYSMIIFLLFISIKLNREITNESKFTFN